MNAPGRDESGSCSYPRRFPPSVDNYTHVTPLLRNAAGPFRRASTRWPAIRLSRPSTRLCLEARQSFVRSRTPTVSNQSAPVSEDAENPRRGLSGDEIMPGERRTGRHSPRDSSTLLETFSAHRRPVRRGSERRTEATRLYGVVSGSWWSSGSRRPCNPGRPARATRGCRARSGSRPSTPRRP